MQDFISKESETSAFIEAKAVALIYCLIKKNDIFHLSEMRKQELHYVMSNSLGFGGHNASIIFKKYGEE